MTRLPVLHTARRLLTLGLLLCGCQPIAPNARGPFAGEYQGDIHYVEIDIEADSEIAEAAGVTGTPTIQFFKDKERLHSVVSSGAAFNEFKWFMVCCWQCSRQSTVIKQSIAVMRILNRNANARERTAHR